MVTTMPYGNPALAGDAHVSRCAVKHQSDVSLAQGVSPVFIFLALVKCHNSYPRKIRKARDHPLSIQLLKMTAALYKLKNACDWVML